MKSFSDFNHIGGSYFEKISVIHPIGNLIHRQYRFFVHDPENTHPPQSARHSKRGYG
jgi:hypothetical protein